MGVNPNVLMSDQAVLAAAINPQSGAANTYTSGWVSMATYEAILAAVQWGAIAATGLVDAKLEQATNAAGAGAKDITNKAITQVTGSQDNGQALINLRSDELDVENGFDHVRLSITVGDTASPTAATALIAGFILGFCARYQPATDATSVAQVIS